MNNTRVAPLQFMAGTLPHRAMLVVMPTHILAKKKKKSQRLIVLQTVPLANHQEKLVIKYFVNIARSGATMRIDCPLV